MFKCQFVDSLLEALNRGHSASLSLRLYEGFSTDFADEGLLASKDDIMSKVYMGQIVHWCTFMSTPLWFYFPSSDPLIKTGQSMWHKKFGQNWHLKSENKQFYYYQVTNLAVTLQSSIINMPNISRLCGIINYILHTGRTGIWQRHLQHTLNLKLTSELARVKNTNI